MKISVEQMQRFEKEFFDGRFTHQRYGQAFCNYFNLTSCPELFYEEDTRTAKIKAWLNFVDCSKIVEEQMYKITAYSFWIFPQEYWVGSEEEKDELVKELKDQQYSVDVEYIFEGE